MSDLRTVAHQVVEEWRTDFGSVRMASLMMKLEATLAESVPPPEAQTEAEKVAYCAGWWDALEKKRAERDGLLEVVRDAITTLDRSGYPTAAAGLRDAVAKQ